MLKVDELLAMGELVVGHKKTVRNLDTTLPGDDFSEKASKQEVQRILEINGWKECKRDGEVVYLTRPGKTGGVSASLGYVDSNILYVFTSESVPLEGGRAYTPFSLLGVLEFGGDFAAAADSLRSRGFGKEPVIKGLEAAKKPLGIQIMSVGKLLSQDTKLDWLVDNVLLKDGLHFLSGPAGGGKSWVAMELAKVVCRGDRFFGCYHSQKTKVMYLDEEMGANLSAYRMGRLQFKEDDGLYYMGRQGFHLSNDEHRSRTAEFISKNGVGFVIFDTLRGTCPGLKENEAEHVTRLRSWYKDFQLVGATVLVLHHDRKGGAGEGGVDSDRMAGSADIAGMADMAYGLDKSGGGWYTLSTTKNRLLSEEDSLRVSYEMIDGGDGELAFKVVNVREKRRETIEMEMEEVLAYLRLKGEAGAMMISAETGLQKSKVDGIVKMLHEKGLINRDKDGVFSPQQMFGGIN